MLRLLFWPIRMILLAGAIFGFAHIPFHGEPVWKYGYRQAETYWDQGKSQIQHLLYERRVRRWGVRRSAHPKENIRVSEEKYLEEILDSRTHH